MIKFVIITCLGVYYLFYIDLDILRYNVLKIYVKHTYINPNKSLIYTLNYIDLVDI